MLRKRAIHRDMTDINGYAAKRLKDMAQSLDGLAKTFGKKPTLFLEDVAVMLRTGRIFATTRIC